MLDKIFVISVKEAEKRRKQFFEKNNINAELYLVDRDKENPVRGNYNSHKKIIDISKSRNYETILIFEDDAYPLKSWNEINKYIYNFLKSPPLKWSILMLGYLPIKLEKTENKNIMKVNCAYDGHAYLVNIKNISINSWNNVSLDSHIFCNNLEPKNLFYSIFVNKIKSNIYCHYPMLFRQKAEKSYIDPVDLYQDYFFNFYGYDNTIILSSYFNIIYFSIFLILTILLFIFILVFVKINR